MDGLIKNGRTKWTGDGRFKQRRKDGTKRRKQSEVLRIDETAA